MKCKFPGCTEKLAGCDHLSGKEVQTEFCSDTAALLSIQKYNFQEHLNT